MKRVVKLRVKNFKKFRDETFEFNEDINILVGDNECGKSSVLEAIDLCLNCRLRGRQLSPEIFAEIFSNDCVARYRNGNHSQTSLPELLIEAFLEGEPELKGNNNSEGIDAEGIYLKICFNEDLSTPYESFINTDEILTVPFELYKVEWMSFGWKHILQMAKPMVCLFVDPTRLHPTIGRSRYINNIINASVDPNTRPVLNLSYRQLKMMFNDKSEVQEINKQLNVGSELSEKELKIVADISPAGSWDSNLTLDVDNVSFSHIGKGEQNQIQIKVAIQNKAKDADVVMLEEPENHLSHMNLTRLVSYIEQENSAKQIFLTTHSSFVLNKLSIDKLCLLSCKYVKLKDLNKHTIKTLKRLPGYDTLRMVLTKCSVLVEGPSDELVLKKIYVESRGRLPEEDGIDIIVVRGIGFKVYLDIAKSLKHPVRVVKDNDHDYKKNIVDWLNEDYHDCGFIECYSPVEENQNSLEPALIASNVEDVSALDHFASVVLSERTFEREYCECNDFEAKISFLKNWFDTPSKKVDSAIRIFDSDKKIKYPMYLRSAINFDS